MPTRSPNARFHARNVFRLRYRCAPERNRCDDYELAWSLTSRRPLSQRDSAKQLDLFEEVTHSPYQPGGKRRREVSADLIPAKIISIIGPWPFDFALAS